jgi:hypothetical protein
VLTIQYHLQRWLLLQVLSMPTWGKLASLLLVVIPLLMGGAALYHRATGTEWCGLPRKSKSDICQALEDADAACMANGLNVHYVFPFVDPREEAWWKSYWTQLNAPGMDITQEET